MSGKIGHLNKIFTEGNINQLRSFIAMWYARPDIKEYLMKFIPFEECLNKTFDLEQILSTKKDNIFIHSLD